MQGIYQIKNVITGKVYVGSSSGIKGRWSNHKSDLSRGVHDNSMLQRSYNKHGFEAFEFSILETVSKAADLIEREQHWIDCLQAANRVHGYNLSPLAGSTRGRKHTEESKRKMSEAKKGQPSAMKGKQHTEEAKRLMSIAKKGKETWMKGKQHTEESKRKNSQSHLGQIPWAKGQGSIPEDIYKKMYSDELNKRRSETMKQRCADPEYMARRWSDEQKENHRVKMAEAAIRRKLKSQENT